MPPITNDTYIKLQYPDFRIIRNIMLEIEDLNPEELKVLSKVEKIMKLMEGKFRSFSLSKREEILRNSNTTNEEVLERKSE